MTYTAPATDWYGLVVFANQRRDEHEHVRDTDRPAQRLRAVDFDGL